MAPSSRRRERPLHLESLEPRLALAAVAGIVDTTPPVVRSVALPAGGTYGAGSVLSFKVKFNEPVRVVGDQAAMSLPVEVGSAMREARYMSGSGTKTLAFRLTVTANDVDTDGIRLGRVNDAAIRDFDFNQANASPRLVDLANNPARNAIPAGVNTSRIRVDAIGPAVAGVSDFLTRVVKRGNRVSLQVTFDGPVTVIGTPKVPVTIGGVGRQLAYVAGSKTSRLTFAVTLPKNVSVEQPMFRDTPGLAGRAIILPAGAALRDRLGNSVSPLIPLPSLPQQQAKNGEIYAAVSEAGSFQIWAITPDGKNRRQVTSKERDGLDRASHPSVSPDGTLIAFSGFTGGKADIYVINADGTNLRKLTSSNADEYQMIPGFSPDGRLIAYCSSLGEESSGLAHLRIMSIDGSDVRQLTDTTDGTYEDTGPKFSPDGTVIVFASDKGNTREHNDIYTINVDRSNLRRLTYGANNSYSRSWSPDGRRIVFNSQVRLNGADPGYGELRIMSANGRHQRKLTSFRRNLRFDPVEPVPGGANAPKLRGDITPAWSPDGKFVVFCGQSKRTGQYELFTINLATRKRTQITHSAPGTNHISAAWSVLPKTGLSLD
jgi:WD40 repeat protein